MKDSYGFSSYFLDGCIGYLAKRAQDLRNNFGQRVLCNLQEIVFEESIMTQFDYMLTEMLEQPKILKSILKDSEIKELAEILIEENVERIYLTGSGDSYCAAWFGAHLGEKWCPDLRIRHYAPFEFVNYSRPELLKGSAVIGISVSGETPRILESTIFANKHGAITIGLTDNPNGKLVKETDYKLLIHASPSEALQNSSYSSEGAKDYTGYHHDVSQTKTYLANLSVLSVLVGYLSERTKKAIQSVHEAFSLVEQVIEQRGTFLKIGQSISNVADRIFFVASGSNSVTGLFGVYKMFEFTLNGFTCDIEEYCHTGYFITTDHTSVVFIAPDAVSLNRIMEIEPVIREELNSQTVVLVDTELKREAGPSSTPIALPKDRVLSPLVLTIPIEFLSYSLAKSKGFNTNLFRGGQDTEKYVSGSYKMIRQSKLQF